MRRSPVLVVAMLCPHHGRPVEAILNTAIERLVDCREKDGCATRSEREDGVIITVRPAGCPVFRDGQA